MKGEEEKELYFERITNEELRNIRLRSIEIKLYGIMIALVGIMFLVLIIITILANNGTSKLTAQCTSLGGIYSSQDDQCYYGGKVVKIDELMKNQGVK